jgi:LPXTG-motif cell wall-anchored protein
MKRFLAVGIALVMVLVVVPFTAFAAEPVEVWVGDETKENNYATIQEAVDAVAGGGTVHVVAGSYVEQVIINKSMSLIGDEGAIIKAPEIPETFTVPEGSKSWEPVIFVYGGTRTGNAISGEEQVNVMISGFTIDGDARKPAERAAGILLRNVTGTISGNIFINFDLNMETFGVMVNGNSDVAIKENDISGFGRGGIVIGSWGEFPQPNASIRGNNVETVTHAKWAQNGIQIGWGATGEIIGNTVTGHIWSAGGWGASGILIPGSSNIEVAENTVRNNDYGVSVVGYANFGGHRPSTNINIHDNILSGNTSGVSLQGDVSDTIIVGNTIHSNATGVDVWDYDPSDWTGGGVPVRNKADGNKFYENDNAIVVWPLLADNEPVPEGFTFDVSGNWWGSTEEPTSIEGDVTYTTWAQNEDLTSFATRIDVEGSEEPFNLEEDVTHIRINVDFKPDEVLSFVHGNMRLDFPVSLLPEGEVEITISKASPEFASRFMMLGNVYSFVMTANGEPVTEFSGPFILTFNYTPDEVDDPSNLVICWFDGSEWIPQDSVVDTELNVVTLELNHWSNFSLMEVDAAEEVDPEEAGDIDVLPQTGTYVMWLLPLGFMLLLAGARLLRRKEVA